MKCTTSSPPTARSTAFLAAGAIADDAGCGACCGTSGVIPGDGMTVLSTANRNFKARMGNATAEIYLASPAACGATLRRPTGRMPMPRAVSPGRALGATTSSGRARVFGDDVNTDYIISSSRKRETIDRVRARAVSARRRRARRSPHPCGRATCIVAGRNFGCGSAMEVAVTVIQAAGHPRRDRAHIRAELLPQRHQQRPARGRMRHVVISGRRWRVDRDGPAAGDRRGALERRWARAVPAAAP